jgi:hypothetical protein
MGVFGPSLEVDGVPGMLKGLCAVLLVRNPMEPLTHARAQVLDSSGDRIIDGGSQPIAPTTLERYQHQFQVSVFPFPVQAEGDITFRFTFNNGDEIGSEGRVTVRRKAPPEVAPTAPAL